MNRHNCLRGNQIITKKNSFVLKIRGEEPFGFGGIRRVPGAECGVRSAECGVRSAECGVRSAECGVRSAECGVRSAECGVRSVENAKCRKCGMQKMWNAENSGCRKCGV